MAFRRISAAAVVMVFVVGCGDGTMMQSDGGTHDSGTMQTSDSGMMVDSGMPDSGQPDAAVDCAAAMHDAVLGTLELQMGFALNGSSVLPDDVTAVVSLDGGAAAMFGVHAPFTGAAAKIVSLGAFPSLALGSVAQEIIDVSITDAGTGYPNTFLATDGVNLISGYTYAAQTGKLIVFNPGLNTHEWIDSPGNYTAAFVSGRFVVNAKGLGAESGTGLFSLTLGTPHTTKALATFDSSDMPGNGHTVITDNGVLVAGYFNGNDFKNYLRAAPPSTYAGPLTGGTSFTWKSSSTEVYAGDDVGDVSAFGNDLAVLRSSYDSSFNLVFKDVVKMPLTLSGSGVQTVTVGSATPILKPKNSCTSVLFLSKMGAELLAAVKDKNGRRLVRIKVQ